ncbi:MAG TPA: hypothetical protein VGJ33_16235 [Candidatus Angelobacter sp.]|jgi:hypothetical protein
MSNKKGVFNGPQHQEEVEMLLRGEIKQFQVLPIALDTVGLYTTGANAQGAFELEGNTLVCLNQWLDKEYNSLVSLTGNLANVFVRFNHVDAPWMPIGNPTSAVSRVTCSYTLTIGRFWLYVAVPSAGNKIFLMLTRGVCMYSNGDLGPVVIGAYQTPTWQSLK